MNKEQTEQVITLVFATVIFILGWISVYLFSIGFYNPWLTNLIFVFVIILATFLAIAMGGLTIVLSIYGINDARGY